MGLHEYRPPSAHGGITQAWVYRDDLRHLAQIAEETSRWLSAQGREVHYDAADALHEIVEAHRKQGTLALKPQGPPWPVFWRGKAHPAKERPNARPGASGEAGGH